jgi:hypothetical protein
MAHAGISIGASVGGVTSSNAFETDAEGRFRANPLSANRYTVAAYAPQGEPYLIATTGFFAWNKGAVEHRVDLSLQRGMVLHGKVTEEGSGRPVGGAVLGYVVSSRTPAQSASLTGRPLTRPDGSYTLTVLPKPGTLIVLGPSEDYALESRSERMVREGRPGGRRWYSHAFIHCDFKPGDTSHEVNVVLRRGTTARAQVTGPDDKPVEEARVFSRLLLIPQPVPWRLFLGTHYGTVRDGRFDLHGLAPDVEVPAFFLDSKHKLGASVRFSAKAAVSTTINVRLEPCGAALARMVDPEGRPITGYRDPSMIVMQVTPGKVPAISGPREESELSPDGDFLARIDPAHYTDLVSDSGGRIIFPALIPGATFQVFDKTARNADGRRQLRKEFVARAGETMDLGDIRIEKPES